MNERVLAHFGWSCDPFDLGRIPRAPILEPGQRTTAEAAAARLAEGADLVAACGPPGSGRTVVARGLAAALAAAGRRAALLVPPSLPSVETFAGAILRAFGVPDADSPAAARFDAALGGAVDAPPPVLVVDEAERLPPALLSALRGFTALRVVLMGGPDLMRRLVLDLLSTPRVRLVPIEPLSEEDCLSILDRRLAEAGVSPLGEGDETLGPHRGLFDLSTASALCLLAAGRPGLLLYLAGSAATKAASTKSRWILGSHVRSAADDLGLGAPAAEAPAPERRRIAPEEAAPPALPGAQRWRRPTYDAGLRLFPPGWTFPDASLENLAVRAGGAG